ncbi:MAG: hypothetical protein QF755_02750 [Candidatus Peribacteraceae bacterium]|nr:hypothetical protein [Candidatus Peribacteraceae bacterium]MDP6995980.1 hypothetical protein [Candidatus Poribacteria bacterium]
MEGRFLREDSQFKTNYRTHPVIIKPYPGRVYRSWEDCFFQEFYQVIATEELMEELTEKQQEAMNWILTNAGDRFAYDQQAQMITTLTIISRIPGNKTSSGWIG